MVDAMLANSLPAPLDDDLRESFLARDPDGRLELLRAQAARCRAASHLDLYRACSLLTLDRDKAPVLFARALLRTLGQALGKRPVIHGPGSAEISFDESWLIRLIDRLECGDTDSFTFLLSRRIPHEHRRSVAFLLHGLITPPDIDAKPVQSCANI